MAVEVKIKPEVAELHLPENLEIQVEEVYGELFSLYREDTTKSYEGSIKDLTGYKENYEKRLYITKKAKKLGVPYEDFVKVVDRIASKLIEELKLKEATIDEKDLPNITS